VSDVFSGIGVGSTAALGNAFWLRHQEFKPEKSKHGPHFEEQNLSQAIAQSAAELRAEFSKLEAESQQIMDALLLIFEDPELVSMASPHLAEGWDAATALNLALDDYASLFAGDSDFETRAGDLKALASRAIAKLRGTRSDIEFPIDSKIVVIARDLSPLDTAKFNSSVVGVVTELGGPTSHAAIICRSRGIPAVVACGDLDSIVDGSPVLVDPEGNRIVVDGKISDATSAIEFVALRDEPLIPVRANIGSVEDAVLASKTAAVGVGLFRTEVLYLGATREPDVSQQAASYQAVLEAAPLGEVTVRTLDAGSDKPVPFLGLAAEENPALGVRGYRLASLHPQFLKNQLKAIALAAEKSGREVAVMAPMISTVAEAREFAELGRAVGLSKLGIMIETPAIAGMVHRLGGIVDFLSIGTNDLSQYLFAADRMHPSLGALLNPWQPALLHSVNEVVSQAKRLGIPVGICGESAANPLLSVVFAGMGAASVSVSPAAVGAVASALRSITHDGARKLAELVLSADSPEAAIATARRQAGV
jgi:phosphotransferase system enzyme I (PtsI)